MTNDQLKYAKTPDQPSETFPPAGWVGACTWGRRANWFECVLLPGKAIAVNKFGQWMVLEPGRVVSVQFLRELPSEADLEREEIICAAAMAMEEDAVITEYDAAVALYDKGLLRELTAGPSPEPAVPLSPREQGYRCGLVYRSLPDSEKASEEWRAHAQRIIWHLNRTGMLKSERRINIEKGEADRGAREPTLDPMTDSPKPRDVWHQPGKRTDLPFTVGNSK